MVRSFRSSSSMYLPLLAICAVFSAGCSGGAAASGRCGTHSYTYVAIPAAGVGGAGWYDGDYGGGWYDPGDDGNDYSGIGDGSGSDDGSYSDDGSGDNGSYDDGSGDNGSGDDGSSDNGSYDDGSGDDGSGDDGSGSTDDGSGDDGSGDDGSGDDGTASKHHLHLTNANLHTQTSSSSSQSSCYAYTCTLVCAVDSANEREAQGFSGVSQQDACDTAQHGLENWAHDSLGRDIGACKQVSSSDASNGSAGPATPGSRTPASPSVTQGFSSSSGSGPHTRASSIRAPR